MHSINFWDIQPYLFSVSGIIFIVFALFKKTKRENPGITSERTEGTIHELHGNASPSRNTNEFQSNTEDKIIVKFVTRRREWITAPIKKIPGTYNPRQYKIGNKVNVIYNPYNPADFIVETKQSEKNARIFIAIVGVLSLVIGILQILM